VPCSTTNAEMPFLPLSGSVTAKTTITSPTDPWVVKVFEPLSTHAAPSRRAVVLVPPASEPAVGSVRLQPPILRPLASGTR